MDPNIYGPPVDREPTDDDPYLPAADEDDDDAVADRLAAKITDDDEDEAVEADAQAEDGTATAAKPSPPPQQDLGALRQQVYAAAQADPDLALINRPDLQQQLAQSNPHEFIRWRARAEQKYAQFEAIDRHIEQQRLAAEQAKLSEIDPDFAHPKRGTALKQEMRRALKDEYRFTDAELAGIADARIINVVRDAMRYRATSQVKATKGGTRRSGLPKNMPRGLHDRAAVIAKLI